jgi:hypothetical protein
MKLFVLAIMLAAMAAAVACVLGLLVFALAEPAIECGSLAPGIDAHTGPPGTELPLRVAATREMEAGPGPQP